MEKKSFFYPLVFFSIFIFALGLIIYPQNTAQAVRDAMMLCFQSVIPSLFPFLVTAKLVTNLRSGNHFKKALNRIMFPLFSVSTAVTPAILLGFIGGYPVGAATIASLYKDKLCSKEEAERALAFCNNCGPAFIIGAIGAGVFSSTQVGISLLVIHVFSAITVGVIFRLARPMTKNRFHLTSETGSVKTSFHKAFTDAVLSALNSSLNISAYIILFSALICVLDIFKFFSTISYLLSILSGVDMNLTEAIISGLFEMTIGAYSLGKYASFKMQYIIISFLLGWGGLSVHCQALSCISDYNLKTKQYFIGKVMHGTISAFFAYIYTSAFVYSVFKPIYLVSLVFCALVIIFILNFLKKGWKKRKK